MEQLIEIKKATEELLSEKKWAQARDLFRELPAPDIADFLLDLDKSDRVLMFRLLPRPLASEVFSYLEPKQKDDLLSGLTEEEARRVLAELSPDDRTNFFEDLPGEATQRLINLQSPEDRKETLQLLGFPEQSVGRLMTPDYVAVRPDWTIGRALEHIRLRGKNSETINVIYVVDSFWKLIDALDLRRFVLAPVEQSVAAIMDHLFVSISALEDREKAVSTIQHYDLVALPVVDSQGCFSALLRLTTCWTWLRQKPRKTSTASLPWSPSKQAIGKQGFGPFFGSGLGGSRV